MKTRLFSPIVALAVLLSLITVLALPVPALSATSLFPSQTTQTLSATASSSCSSGFYQGTFSTAWEAKIRHGGAGGYRAKLNTELFWTGGTVPWPNSGTMHLTLTYSSSTGYATMTVNGALPAYNPVVITAQVPGANGKLLLTGKTSPEAVGIVAVSNVTLSGATVSPCSSFTAQGTDGTRDVKYLIIDSVSGDFTLACDVLFAWGSNPVDEGPALQIAVENLPPPTPAPTPTPPPGSQTQPTSVGSSVTVDFGYIRVTFAQIIVSGNTWLGTATVDTSRNPAKSALSIVDIGTTASYQAPIQIAWIYDMSGLEEPEKLKIYHFNGSKWENITTSVDIANNTVYGEVASLSPFLLSLGGCFIATAAYGSPLDSHVDTLRSFRDHYLETNPLGSAFVSLYYKISPPLADFIDEHPSLKPVVRVALIPAVAISSTALNTTPLQKLFISLALLASLSIAIALVLRQRAHPQRMRQQ